MSTDRMLRMRARQQAAQQKFVARLAQAQATAPSHGFVVRLPWPAGDGAAAGGVFEP